MQKPVIILFTILFATTTFLILTEKTYAATITTAKEDGTITDTFLMGEKVRIIATSTTTITKVTVIDPDGLIRYTENTITFKYDKTIDGITDKPGIWKITVTEDSEFEPLTEQQTETQSTTSTTYLTATNNVAPETPLGTIAILATFLAAFGILASRKNR